MSSHSNPQQSAGLLLFRGRGDALEVLLVHPGGPFWKGKDPGAWSIPKGKLQPGEAALEAARREFHEETGFAPAGEFHPLEPIRQRSGKVVAAWAVEADWDPAGLRSNSFSLEWPPHSGMQAEFPEIDRAEWFSLLEARRKILPAQLPLLDQLNALLAARESPGGEHL
jgi:predicted NUDIX family NTP pyrophosphohydrolase